MIKNYFLLFTFASIYLDFFQNKAFLASKSIPLWVPFLFCKNSEEGFVISRKSCNSSLTSNFCILKIDTFIYGMKETYPFHAATVMPTYTFYRSRDLTIIL